MVKLFLNYLFSIKRLRRSRIYICTPLVAHRVLSSGDTFLCHYSNWVYEYTVVDYLYGVYFCTRRFTFRRYKNAK